MSQEKESEFHEKMNQEIERGIEELREFVQNQAEQKMQKEAEQVLDATQIVESASLDKELEPMDAPLDASLDKMALDKTALDKVAMAPLDVLPDASENQTHLLLQEIQALQAYVELQLSRQRELFQGIETIVKTHGDTVSESSKSIKRLRMVVNKVEEEQGTLQSIYEEFDRKYQEDQAEVRKQLTELREYVRDPGANKRKKNVQDLEYLEREINKFK